MIPLVVSVRAERPGAVGAQPRVVDVGGRAGMQHRRPGRGYPGGGRVHDIGHDAGDVVRAAAVQREVDELPGDGLGVLDGLPASRAASRR